jgi:hypothetical protein
LPVIASDVRTAMTSWTARPNCHRFGGDFRRNRRSSNSALVRNLKIMVITHWLIELTNNSILHRKFLIAPRGIEKARRAEPISSIAGPSYVRPSNPVEGVNCHAFLSYRSIHATCRQQPSGKSHAIKTIGIVVVAFWAASAAGILFVIMTLTFIRTNSAALAA